MDPIQRGRRQRHRSQGAPKTEKKKKSYEKTSLLKTGQQQVNHLLEQNRKENCSPRSDKLMGGEKVAHPFNQAAKKGVKQTWDTPWVNAFKPYCVNQK